MRAAGRVSSQRRHEAAPALSSDPRYFGFNLALPKKCSVRGGPQSGLSNQPSGPAKSEQRPCACDGRSPRTRSSLLICQGTEECPRLPPSRRNSAHKNSGHNEMNDPTTTTLASPGSPRTFFGHPFGLVTCFMVEFFERFTYYGMRSMLVPFLSRGRHRGQPGVRGHGSTAGAVYALFTGGAYLLAIPGGWIADRLDRPAQGHLRRTACSSRRAISSSRSRRRPRCSTRACS